MIRKGVLPKHDSVYGCLQEHCFVLQSDGYNERTIGSALIGLGVDTMLKNDVSPVDIIRIVDFVIQRRERNGQ